MKKILISTITFLLIVSISFAQKIPAKKDVLKAMELANEYFMYTWPDPAKSIVVKGIERPSHIWTRAVYYEGLMALIQIDKQAIYYNYAVQWAQSHNWSFRKGIQTRNADDQCAGQTYIDLYGYEKQPNRIDSVKASIGLMVASTKVDDWFWIDALQMAMPVFAKLGVVYNDTAYFRKMYDIYAFSKYKHGGNGLYNQQENLWWRDKDFVPPYKEPNGANCYWARGNGWVVAALVRVLSILPKTDAHYNEYLKDYMDMMTALAPLQREDGFWNVSLKDPTHFGGKELTGTDLFVYGMAWGINNKLLDQKKYLPIVIKAWNATVKDCLHPNGFLGYVQGTGKEPKDGQPVTYDSKPDFEDYGLGCFLLAGSEMYKLK